MLEGQKIFGLPLTCGGLRINSYVRVFPHDNLLHFTLYGEYEGLNGAALYKMEVAGFGGEGDPTALALAVVFGVSPAELFSPLTDTPRHRKPGR